MTTVMSPPLSPIVSPRTTLPMSSGYPSPNTHNAHVSMPSGTQGHPGNQDFRRRSTLDRSPSYARDRMSTYSVRSNTSSRPSRTASAIFPTIPSITMYTQVRDFAYQPNHPFYYGPPPDPSATASGQSTPALEGSFGSPDLPQTPLALRTNWSEQVSGGAGQQLAPIAFGDSAEDHGPPYSEDEDLQSPVVMSSRQRKQYSDERGYFTGTNGDGSENYYLTDPAEEAGGPGGVVETYQAEQARHGSHSRHISHSLDPSNTYFHEGGWDNQHLGVSGLTYDASRLSRDFSFTIASPDEEMHGKAVALFDFAPENDNELPLIEGQVIWVSYRNGQGWLVAEDPKTRETGLVPEEYVRLFKHIEAAGWQSLTGEGATHDEQQSTSEATAPAQVGQEGVASSLALAANSGGLPESGEHARNTSITSNGENSHPAVQSTFSTSSKDLEPYPHPLPTGSHTGQAPPLITHQRSDSQAPTEMLLSPVAASPVETRRKSTELDRRKSADGKSGKSPSRQGSMSSKAGKRTSRNGKRG